jgi:thioredoxin-dependent peroxiredoxin
MKLSRHRLCWIFAMALAAVALPLSAEPNHMPAVGDRVPLVCGRNQDGRKWRLADHLGKGFIFLYFYPQDNTTASIEEASSLRDNMAELKRAGVYVVGVSFNHKRAQKDFAFKYNLSYPLIADVDGHIADAFGTRLARLRLDRRVSFIIGLDGHIIHITDSPDPKVHIREMAETLSSLSAEASL